VTRGRSRACVPRLQGRVERADIQDDSVVATAYREELVIVSCRTTVPASDLVVAAEVSRILEKRSALKNPPVSLAVSDAVALGIAGIMRSKTDSGRVLDRFFRRGSIDSADLLAAARAEQGFASPEGHAALYCLIGWVHSQVHHLQTTA
jgi:hypothetical protein